MKFTRRNNIATKQLYWASIKVRVYFEVYDKLQGTKVIKHVTERVSYYIKAMELEQAREQILSKATEDYPNSGLVLFSIRKVSASKE